jgi:hypothetical protein
VLRCVDVSIESLEEDSNIFRRYLIESVTNLLVCAPGQNDDVFDNLVDVWEEVKLTDTVDTICNYAECEELFEAIGQFKDGRNIVMPQLCHSTSDRQLF